MVHYELKVKSVNEREAGKVEIGTKEYIMAKRGSKFCILATNKSEYCCDVYIYIHNVLLGCWRVDAHCTLTIKKDIRTDKSFSFDNSYHHIEQGILEADRCHESSISAEFYPSNNRDLVNHHRKGIYQGTTASLANHEIDWRKVVHITLPIMICDHEVVAN